MARNTQSRNTGARNAGRAGASPLLRWTVFLFLCSLVAGLSFAGGGYLGLTEKVAELEEPEDLSTHPTYIYSQPLGDNGESTRVIGSIFGGENRKTAPLDEMPQSLLDALVAKEDERFREHGGVDFWGITRALWTDVRAGGAVEGGSTITQQYARNAYLSQDRSVSRKLKEMALAVEIERQHSKDEILAKYLNTVYFGNNAYGAAAAAETYFDKSLGDLSISESAALVGLLTSPSTIGADPEEARWHRDTTLQQAFEGGYIARQDYVDALEEPLPEEWPAGAMAGGGLEGPQLTRNYTELVRDELVERYGSNTVLQGGLSVYTTLDLRAQEAAQETLYGEEGYLSGTEDPDAALVSLEPGTGKVRAMIGNRDQSSQFNLVTQAQRQPGSSFKPFALVAALEQGIDPETEFVSEDKEYELDHGFEETEEWQVENYGGTERGPISLQEALWESDNTVFTDLATNAGGRGLENGPEAIADAAERLGVSAQIDTDHPSLVLGAQEVSPMDMAKAYATIANYGRAVEPVTIERVVRDEDTSGEELVYEAPEPSGEQVIDEEVAEEAIRIMEGDIERGINSNASLGDRPAAGKSGTTDSFFDAWFIGFTPQLTTSVWLGYEEGGKTLDQVADGSPVVGTSYPADIWRDYNEIALDDEPVEEFRGDPLPEPEPPTRQASGTEEPEIPAEPAAAQPAAPPRDGAVPDPAAVPRAVPAAAVQEPAPGPMPGTE